MRIVLALAILAAAATAACSTNSDDSSSAADASEGPNRPLGASCDPSLPNACAAAPTTCSANICASGVCASILLEDSGSNCSGLGDGSALPPTGSVCETSSDCDGGAVCGFYAMAGCEVTGVCVVAATTSSGLPSPACGCNGLADPYVANGFTGTPAASPVACDEGGAPDGAVNNDAGNDGGADAAVDATLGSGDAGADGAVDSGTAVSDGAPE